MKMNFEIIVGKKLINQQLSASGNAISDKWNKVSMMNSANNLNLGLEFPISLSTSRFQTLDCDFFAVRQHTFVDVSEPALTQEVRLSEARGGGNELVVGESVLVEGHWS